MDVGDDDCTDALADSTDLAAGDAVSDLAAGVFCDDLTAGGVADSFACVVLIGTSEASTFEDNREARLKGMLEPCDLEEDEADFDPDADALPEAVEGGSLTPNKLTL